jgi:hypothetical protein
MIETLGRAGLTLAEGLEREEDLDAVKAALFREYVVRRVMGESGETREIVVEALDAGDSMDQEGVLALTDGEPTTLADALNTYVMELADNATNDDVRSIVTDLGALLNYPWPGVEGEADVTTITQAIHTTYVRLVKEAPYWQLDMLTWDELSQDQRNLATAVVSDLVSRGLRFPG